MTGTNVFSARSIITMDPDHPRATGVAVADGRIVGVGDPAELAEAHGVPVDETLADQVLVPGFVEAHSHVLEGAFWMFNYIGRFGRTAPDGSWWPGCESLDEAVDRLQRFEAELDDPDAPLIAWGFDPIYFPGTRLNRSHLDRVSTTRPVLVMHASIHICSVNSYCLEQSGIDRGHPMEGIVKDAEGEPTGELAEPPAMNLAGSTFISLMRSVIDPQALRNFGDSARNSGCTTITDLGATPLALVEDSWPAVVNDPAFPARLVPYAGAMGAPPADLLETVARLEARSTDKIHFGRIKLFTDGSIQGFTARIATDTYYNGEPNGLWLTAPDQLMEVVAEIHAARRSVHCHCNGDEASEVFIQAVEAAQAADPWDDHRHTVTHSQMTTAEQYERMAAVGMAANIFSNHLWFWGDQHHDITLGPERAASMDACATADAKGVRYTLHSDATVTPLGHLHTMWCAVNRVTPSGRVLGPDERISAERALRAATIDAAYTLHLDDRIGSIEVGKFADFAVLGDDPLEVDPMAIRDIEVWGTVLAGHLQPNP